MSKTVAVVLGGGKGTRMDILCKERSKLVLPFAGKFKVVDFSLSNCINSKIENIAVLVDYRRETLSRYLEGWSESNLSNKPLSILKPYNGSYRGTADAILQNLEYLQQAENVIVLSGDHIYRMDYRQMLSFHKTAKAAITIGVVTVPLNQVHRFGIVKTDSDYRITSFVEKPEAAASNLASMGIYIFNKKVLEKFLIEDASKDSSPHDLGYAIIPEMLKQNAAVFAYKFDSYWEDIGTMEAYYQANMKLLGESPSLSLNGKWPVLARYPNAGLARIFIQDNVANSIISQGCDIKGNVINSILSPGVVVGEKATVKDSIIMENTIIGENSTIESCIIDEYSNVGNFCYVGFPSKVTTYENSGITVLGKGTNVPSYTAIGQNSRISTDMNTIDLFKEAARDSIATHSYY